MKVFISYARRDEERVAAVVKGLRVLGMDVWLDEALVGGQSWWDGILKRIRDADVFVAAVSRSSLKSEACQSEREYAHALGRPMLPVIVEHVPTSVLPDDIASVQCIDYTDASNERAFQLAAAVQQAQAPPPLPDPLPEAPPIPLSYLGKLGHEIASEELTLDQQLALVARLRAAAERPDDREGALELLQRMQARNDLYFAAAREIENALEVAAPAGTASSAGPTGGGTATATPPRVEPTARPSSNPGVYAGGSRTASPAQQDGTIKPHLGLSILAALLFFPTGVPAIVYAARVSPALARGDQAGAAKAAARVRALLWTTFIIFAILAIIIAASGGSNSSTT